MCNYNRMTMSQLPVWVILLQWSRANNIFCIEMLTFTIQSNHPDALDGPGFYPDGCYHKRG